MTDASGDETQTVDVQLVRRDGYRFEVSWGLPGASTEFLDEPSPLGSGTGPNASRLVAAAVAHCLSSSLLFCLAKSRVSVEGMHATARAEIRRNERGRWRLAHITVELAPTIPHGSAPPFERCQSLFEDFCIVTESIRHGIPVDVTWREAPGQTKTA